MPHFRSLLALSLLAATVSAAPVLAQEPTLYKTSGVQLGAYLSGTGATYDGSDETDSGSGLTLRLGYGFNERISIYAAGTGASMEQGDYTLGHFDVGARFLVSQARLRPYLQAAYTGRAASIDIGGETLDIRGAGPSIGGGIEYAFGRAAALDVGLNYSLGSYSEGRLGGGEWEDFGSEDLSSTSARVDIGLIWRP